MQETTEKKHSKLKSVKLWFAIWAALLLCVVVWGVIFRNADGLTPVALGLIAIIMEFFGINYKQKKLYKNDQNIEA